MAKIKTIVKKFLSLTKSLLVKHLAYFKHHRKRILITSGMTLVILVVSYILSNWDYAITGESTVLKIVASIQQYINSDKENSSSDLDKFVFINVAYDNMLVDATEETISAYETGALMGNTSITDRKKLYTFLKAIENAEYEYIIIDIGLPTKYKTAYDDSLYNQIQKMNRIVVAAENSLKYIDPRIKDKSYSVNYSTNIINSDLAKIPLEQNGMSTLSFKVYQDIQKSKDPTYWGFHRIGFLYFDDCSLSKRTIYPKLYLTNRMQTVSPSENGDESDPKEYIPLYENLGTYVLEEEFNEAASTDEIQQTLNSVYKNRIVILGTFDNNEDVHSTYMSDMNGTLIIANSILSLLNRTHHISFLSFVILFVFFYFISHQILYGRHLNTSLLDIVTGDMRNHSMVKIIPIVIVWTYYSLFVSIICAILFIMFSEVHDLLFTSTLLTIINVIVILIRKCKSSK